MSDGAATVALVLRAEWSPDTGEAWIVGRLPSGRDVRLLELESIEDADWLIRKLSDDAKEMEPDG